MAAVTRRHARLDLIDQLLTELLERPDGEWRTALAEACSRHPTAAAELRRRFGQLERLGVADPVEATVAHEPAATPPERFGPYRLLRQLGGGGMGVVWLAVHERLGREVAIKMIRPERFWFEPARERFRREVEAVARLQHPGCVQIQEVGEAAGVPYFAMEHVPGASCDVLLAALRRERGADAPARLTGADLAAALGHAAAGGSGSGDLFLGPWWRTAARIALAAAEALAHAHARGVVHRDLKPSNLMVTPDGRVVVIDFGLAAAAGADPLTRDLSHLGSVPYMAPEQLRGEAQATGPRTDVYGLGVCLYELLTLSPPFAADSDERLRAAILAGECPGLRRRNPAMPGDLAVVTARAMHPDVARRYGSALELAADLTAVLADQPVRARPDSPWTRLLRLARRRPATTTALLLAVLAVIVLPMAFSIAIAGQRDRAIEAEQLARRREYAANIAAAGAALQAGNGGEARLRLAACPEDLRGFEWRHLMLALDSSLFAIDLGAPVTAVAVSPDGATLAAAGADGRAGLFAVADGRRRRDLASVDGTPIDQFAFTAGGDELLAVTAAGGVLAFATDSGQLLRQRPAASPDERPCLPTIAGRVVLARGAGRVADLDPRSFTVRQNLALATGDWPEHDRVVLANDEIAVGGPEGVSIWSLSDGHGRGNLDCPGGVHLRAATADLRLLAGVADDAVVLFDRAATAPRRLDLGNRRAEAVVLPRDGAFAAVACESGEILVYDHRAGRLLRTLHGHRGHVPVAASVGSLPLFVTGGADGTVRLWSCLSSNEQTELRGIGEGRALGVGGPDRLLTGGEDAVLRAVDVATGAIAWSASHTHWVNGLAVLDTEGLVVSSVGTTLRFWSLADGTERGELALPPETDLAARMLVDDERQLLFVGGRLGHLTTIDLATRRVLGSTRGHTDVVCGLALASGTRRLYTCGFDGRLFVHEPAGVAPPRLLAAIEGRCRALAIRDDQMFLSVVTATGDSTLQVRDLRAGSVLATRTVDDVPTAIVAIDDERFALGTERGHVAIWDRATLVPVFDARWFTGTVRNLVIGPRGDWLVAMGLGGEPRILRASASATAPDRAHERARIAALRDRAATALREHVWTPIAARALAQDPFLDGRQRELAVAMLPPPNRWTLASTAFERFARWRDGGAPSPSLRELHAALGEAVDATGDPHDLYTRCAFALGAIRCGEPERALAVLAPVSIGDDAGPDDGRGWFRPAIHFARGMAHRQLGDRPGAERERTVLASLVAGPFAIDPRAALFLRELDDALR